jgi:hypothetical protein
MLKRFVLAILLVAGLGGGLSACGRQEAAVPKAVEVAESGKGADASAPLTTGFNVGDAETSIELNLELDPVTAAVAGVKEDRVLNAKRQLSQSSVTVTTPGLKEFWVKLRVRPARPFIERPVVLRGVIERDNQPLASFQVKLGKYAMEEDPDSPKEFRVNLLADLPTMPASMLVFAKAEVLLLPTGTDEATIDVANVTVAEGDISAKISNPLRVVAQYAPLALPAETPAAAPSPTPAETPAQ